MAKACRLSRALALGRAALCSPASSPAELAHAQLRIHPFCSNTTPENPDEPGESESLFGVSPRPPPASSSPWLRATRRDVQPDGDDGAAARSSSSGTGGEQASRPGSWKWPRDSESEGLFSASSTASKAGGSETAFWRSLVNKPKETGTDEESSWDFLKNLSSDAPRNISQGSSHSSYRKLGDAGFDFLSEAPDLPAKDTERADPDVGEASILHSASFNLLIDSFRKSSMQSDREGISTQTWQELKSGDTWTKTLDSRSLAEVEGNFYTAQDRAPKKEEKEWTYEELGEKLRQVRPPKEQQLAGAMGLSFKELRDRLEKMEQLEKEVPQLDRLSEFKELRDSMEELRAAASPKSVSSRNQLSYEELAFLNTMGTSVTVRPKIEYIPPKDDLLKKYFAPEQMSSKELLKLEIEKLKKEFQMHDSDSGSSQVQIAILTAKINNLNRHLREGPNYKRDKHSRKGLNDMVQYRKRLLRYLRRRDWDVYCNVLTKLHLDDVILEKRA